MQTAKAVGVVLDLTLSQTKDGRRILDNVKRDLIDFVRGFDDEDTFYLYHEHITTTEYRRGKQVHAIASYNTDGYEYDLWYALKQTWYVLEAEDEDFDKVLYLISDRLKENKPIRKLLRLMEKDRSPVRVVVVSLGDLQLFDINTDWHHFPEGKGLAEFFEKENNGHITCSGPAAEDPQRPSAC